MAEGLGVTHHTAEQRLGQSAADMVQDVVRDIQEIVRAEVKLAKAEVSEKASQAGSAAGMFGGAAVAGLLGGMALIATVIAYLALFMPVWAGALVVTFVLLCTAAICYFAGRSRMRAFKPVPEKTVQTLKDDVEWAKHRTR